MDFNIEKVPIRIEIFHASLKFDTEKTNLINIMKSIANVSIGGRKLNFLLI